MILYGLCFRSKADPIKPTGVFCMIVSQWFSSLDLKHKVRYLFVTAMLLCMCFCFLVFYYVLQNRMTSSVIDKGRNNLNSIGQNIETELDNVNNISHLIMVSDNIDAYLETASPSPILTNNACSEIYTILNSFSGTYSVYVFRNDMNYINTGIGITNVNRDAIFNTEWIRRVRNRDGRYIILSNTDGAFSSNTSSEIVSFARVINDLDTQLPIGILVINIPISVFEQTYTRLSGENDHFAYLDADGNVICTDLYFPEYNKLVVSGKGMTQIVNSGLFRQQVISGRRIGDTNLTLVCSTEERIIEGISTEIGWSLLGLLLLTIVIMLVLNAYITKNITVPIHKLVASMSEVKTGLLHRVSVSVNNDEIGSLRDNYNDMLIEIDRLINQLLQQEKDRQKAEMDALQEQIKPHFLYNTLDTIGYMSLQNSPEEVYDAIETLGNFYRKFLSKGSKTIRLGDEIAIVKDYITLQKLRYEDMFEDEYSIQEGLSDCLVPKLILQPLVENSIYHGIRLKGEKGIIRISVTADEKFLRINVFDTGVGMTVEQIRRLMDDNDKKSFGFKGTMDRIRFFYERDDIFDIESEEGKFCSITINIPVSEEHFYVQSDDN